MREADWTFLVHWAPTLGAMVILAVVGLILRASERRDRTARNSRAIRK